MKYFQMLKDNPVLVMDLIKAVLALVILFGVPIPPGLDILVAGLVVAILSVVTRQLVMPVQRANEAITDALNTPAPAEGESYGEILDALETPEAAPAEDAPTA